MSRIMFRQKTPEEIAADAAAKQSREAGTAKIEQQPSAAAPSGSEPSAAEVDDDGFALDLDTGAPKSKKGRKK